MAREILNVYQEFGIPPNLQEHMVRVYGIVNFIQEHWTGEEVDWNLAKKVALLHDMGNIVRFDFEKNPEFLGEEQKNIEHWRKVQKDVIDKYGTDDHEATKKMLEEMGVEKFAIDIILDKSFGNSIQTKDSDNWPLKILSYADMRTLPQGIDTLETRIQDIRERFPKYRERPDFEDLLSAAREIQNQIQTNLNVSVSEITDTSIGLDMENALKFEI